MRSTDDPTLRTLDELFDSGLLPGYTRPRPHKSCICAGAATASHRPRRWIETGTFENRVAKSDYQESGVNEFRSCAKHLLEESAAILSGSTPYLGVGFGFTVTDILV